MNISRALIAGSLLIVFGACVSTAAPGQEMSVASGCGGLCSNSTVQTVMCAGQPGTTGVSGNSRYTHYAGFMGGAFIRPGVTNAAGVALEMDPDNDDDGLTDVAEVSGLAFGSHATTDPNAADTDGDGMDDASEAAGMYDPNDAGHRLAIIAFTNTAGNLGMTWIGKGGGTVNTILWSWDLIDGEFSNTLHSAGYPGGGPSPWYKATNTHMWTESAVTSRYFRVKTQKRYEVCEYWRTEDEMIWTGSNTAGAAVIGRELGTTTRFAYGGRSYQTDGRWISDSGHKQDYWRTMSLYGLSGPLQVIALFPAGTVLILK